MSTAGNPSTTRENSSNSADDVRKKTADLKQNAQELTNAAKTVATEKIGELRDSANQYYEMGRDRAYGYEQSVEDYIREKPMKAVAIAAGIGFVFGACYLRR